MRPVQPAHKKTKRFIWGSLAVLSLIYMIAFGGEFFGMLRFLLGIFKFLVGYDFPNYANTIARDVNVTLFNCLIGFAGVFSLWLALISGQAILPVGNLQEIYRTAFHLVLYMTGQHGPAIFVKDGQVEYSSKEERSREGPGVMVVDFNSAVVMEERDPPIGLPRATSRFNLGFLYALGLTNAHQSPRVCGPGLHFLRPRERLRGEVDLRKHFRIQRKVTCYTREGIELYANVLAIFTIGQDPDILQVAYIGPHRPENLRVVTTAPVQGSDRVRITGIVDELDEADRNEIHHFARVADKLSVMEEFSPLPDTSQQNFDAERVFSAVFARARSTDGKEMLPWADLPTRVAAGFYREILLQINYDDLYDIPGTREHDHNTRFPAPTYKSKLRIRMRNNGILAYRLIQTASGEPFVVNSKAYQPWDLLVSEIRPLTNSKILRDRGIKIIHSGFGDLFPVSDAIYQQRLDTWQATWKRDVNLTLATGELQALRVRGRAQAEAQQDLFYSLSELFSVQNYSNEALAIRVLQSLEAAAADPKTRQLLPANTLDLLNKAYAMLNPDVRAPQSPAGPPPPTPPPPPALGGIP